MASLKRNLVVRGHKRRVGSADVGSNRTTVASRHKKTSNKSVIFALDPDKVQINDIVVLLKTPWGHAALCTGTNQLAEAMPAGVHRRSVIATYVRNPKQIRVLRPRPTLGLNASGRRLADYAEDFYGHAYNLTGALTSFIAWPSPSSKGTYFCSQVIAQIFLDYGMNLHPGRSPAKVMPRDFVESDVLKNVTTECLIRIDPVGDQHEYDSIINTEKQSRLHVIEMKMNRDVFSKCMTRLGKEKPKNVHSLQALWQWLGYKIRPDNHDAVIKLEAGMLEEMERGGYWHFYEQMAAERQALLHELQTIGLELSTGTADVDLVQQWLHFHRHSGVSLARRHEYLHAFRDWENATELLIFKRLAEVFEIETRDTQLLTAQYETLRTLFEGRRAAQPGSS